MSLPQTKFLPLTNCSTQTIEGGSREEKTRSTCLLWLSSMRFFLPPLLFFSSDYPFPLMCLLHQPWEPIFIFNLNHCQQKVVGWTFSITFGLSYMSTLVFKRKHSGCLSFFEALALGHNFWWEVRLRILTQKLWGTSGI